jgi:hypothetical protein
LNVPIFSGLSTSRVDGDAASEREVDEVGGAAIVAFDADDDDVALDESAKTFFSVERRPRS